MAQSGRDPASGGEASPKQPTIEEPKVPLDPADRPLFPDGIKVDRSGNELEQDDGSKPAGFWKAPASKGLASSTSGRTARMTRPIGEELSREQSLPEAGKEWNRAVEEAQLGGESPSSPGRFRPGSHPLLDVPGVRELEQLARPAGSFRISSVNDQDQKAFSPKAAKKLEAKVEAYRDSLILASRSRARIRDLDGVSSAHVQQAAESLLVESHPSRSRLAAAAGIVCGASFSLLISELFGGGSFNGLVLLLLVSTVGTAVLTFTLAKTSPAPKPHSQDQNHDEVLEVLEEHRKTIEQDLRETQRSIEDARQEFADGAREVRYNFDKAVG